MSCGQSYQSAVRIDLNGAQPGHLGAGQRERAGEQGTKSAVSHQGGQMRTQPVGHAKGRDVGCVGGSIHWGLIIDETLSDAPHLRSGSAHRENRSHWPSRGLCATSETRESPYRPAASARLRSVRVAGRSDGPSDSRPLKRTSPMLISLTVDLDLAEEVESTAS